MNIIVLSIRLGGVRTFSGKRSHVAIESLCKWLRDACLLRTFVHVYALILIPLSANAPLSIMLNSLQDRKHIPAAVIHAAKSLAIRVARKIICTECCSFLARSLRKYVNTNVYFLQVVVLTYVHVPYSLLLSNNYDWKYCTYYLNLLFSI